MDWIVAPDQVRRRLVDLLPSTLAAMGVPGFTDTIGLGHCSNAAVLLIDGLGSNLLREHASDAPVLSASDTGSPVAVGFPATTATSITTLGTGNASGVHGIVGYTFAAQSDGALFQPLNWSQVDDRGHRTNVLGTLPPERLQPVETVLQRATDAGVATRTAVPVEFEGSGLSRAALRGAEFRGVRALGDLAAELVSALDSPSPALCYGYHGGLDMLGHIHGPGSLPWLMQLRQVDRLVASVAERLPAESMLIVVADHGMVGVDPAGCVDIDGDPALLDGVRLVGGEVRARYAYTEPGARDDVCAAWRESLGDSGVVVTAEEAIDRGWFGPSIGDGVRERIGDLVAVMREGGMIRSVARPKEAALRGHHGSLTAAEQYVPVSVIRGSANSG